MSSLDAEARCQLVAEHVETYHGGSVHVAQVEGKGRVLIAAADFEPGERILLEYPLLEAMADKAAPAYGELLRLQQEGALEISPFFYWAALCSLTAQEVEGARVAAWPTISQQTQAQALLLHAPDEACQSASPSITSVARALWPAGSGPDLLKLERLLQVWIYNSFDQGEGSLEGGIMYLAASMMSHSCEPNAAWHMDDANSFILHARVAIAEGQEITVPYLGPDDLCLPAEERREILFRTKAFRCACPRCSATLDSSRTFRCPRCAGEAVAATAAEPPPPGGPRMSEGDPLAPAVLGSIVCQNCGKLRVEEAAPLLAAEARLRPWARSQSQFHQPDVPAGVGGVVPQGGDSDTASPATLLQQAEDGGLANTHWIVDAARAAVIAQQPSKAVELLRLRVAAQTATAAGSLGGTKLARLRMALGEALCAEGSVDALREAVTAYDLASQALALLFGDDHPEHQEAASLHAKAAQKLARLSSSSASATARGVPGFIGRNRVGPGALPNKRR